MSALIEPRSHGTLRLVTFPSSTLQITSLTRTDTDKCTRIKEQLLATDQHGRSPLALACSEWKAKENDPKHNKTLSHVIQSLVCSGADPLQLDTGKRSILMLLCGNKGLKSLGHDQQLKIVQTLVEGHKVDAGLIDEDGQLALHVAARTSIAEPVFCYLLEKTDPELASARDENKKSPFEYAVEMMGGSNVSDGGSEKLIVQALSDPALLFRKDDFGALHITPCASNPSRMTDGALEAILESAGFYGKPEDIIRAHSTALSTLVQLFIHSEQKSKLAHLEVYLSSNRYAELLASAQDDHGWTGEMCQRERSGMCDTEPVEANKAITAKLPTNWSHLSKHPSLEADGCTLKGE